VVIRFGRSLALGLVIALVAGSGIAVAGAPYPNPLPDFAHPNTPHQPLLSPGGGDLDRPMLVIYVETSDLKFPQNKDAAFMAGRFFASQFASVADFFRASSFGKLVLSRAAESDTKGNGAVNDGVVEVSLGMTQQQFEGMAAELELKTALQAADPFVNFAAFDTNNDGKVTNSELIVIVSNARQSNICATTTNNDPVSLDGKNIALRMPLVGGGINLVTPIHEVAHAALDLPDLYTSGVGQLDTMGGVQCSGEDTTSRLWELSSWQKLHLGWIAPTVVTTDGYYSVSRYDTTGASFLLYDPLKNTDNYFLVENRVRTFNTYDQVVGDVGLVIWRIDEALFCAKCGAKWIEVMRPDGASNVTDDNKDAWDPSALQTPQRTMSRSWRDGTASNVAVRAIGSSGQVVRAYFDVRGPGVLVDTYDRMNSGPVDIYLGETETISFPVMNTGEQTDTFAFSITIPPGWTASSDTQSLGAGVGSTASIQLTPGLNVATGKITMNATGHSVNDSTIQSSSPVQVNVLRRPTAIAYDGVLSADYHDPATVSATLTDTRSNTPLAGKTVTFTLGTQTASAVTDGAGKASTSIVITQTPGTVSVKADFAGDATYVPSDDTETFTITKEQTTTTYTGPTVILQGASGVTLAAQLLEDGTTAPVPSGQSMTLSLGGQSCTGTADANGNASCTLIYTGALGPQPLSASFAGDAYYEPSADGSKTAVVFAFPSSGAFLLGDDTVAAATPTTTVTWWDASWSSLVELSGGDSPPAFKGYASSVASLPTTTPPASCGGTWATSGGSSAPPSDDVPSYMGVLVTSSVGKDGSAIGGGFSGIVVVATDPGYAPSAGHSGRGRIVAPFCP